MSADNRTTSAPSVETFRAVPDFPGYRVSDHGRVQSCRNWGAGSVGLTDRWRDLKLSDGGRGYLVVSLRKDGKAHRRLVHRLVLEAFVGPRPQGFDCRHLDGDPENNHLSNLVWGTKKENMADRDRHGRTRTRPGELCPTAKLTEADVGEIRRLYAEGTPPKVIRDRFGIANATIFRITRGQRWAHSFTDSPELPPGLMRRSSCKLTLEQVEQVRRLDAEGVKLKDIAVTVGITIDQVKNIKGNRIRKFAPN